MSIEGLKSVTSVSTHAQFHAANSKICQFYTFFIMTDKLNKTNEAEIAGKITTNLKDRKGQPEDEMKMLRKKNQ